VIPVNPGHAEILGDKCYKSLSDIPGPVDIVDIFRVTSASLYLDEPSPRKPRSFGCRRESSTTRRRQGKSRRLKVVQNKCIYQEHSSRA